VLGSVGGQPQNRKHDRLEVGDRQDHPPLIVRLRPDVSNRIAASHHARVAAASLGGRILLAELS
jgi:hypothetical protein